MTENTDKQTLQADEQPVAKSMTPEKESFLDDNSESEQIIAEIKTKTAATAEDFDWEQNKKGQSIYSGSDMAHYEEMYAKTLHAIEEGEITKGRVVSINPKEVVINIGFKSDGSIPVQEFRDMPDLKIGDEVEVYIESREDASGQLKISRKRALSERSWTLVQEALANETIVNGYVKSRTKGGLVVEVFGMDAFLPGSQIDVKPVKDYDQYVGQTMQFKVVKINEIFKNIVVSHKVLIEDDIEAQRMEIISRLEKGQVLEGVIKNIQPFGAFIDLGGVDGLLHITDISWGRVTDPNELLKVDQKLNVVVLGFDDDKKRISLGLKQLTPHPWDQLGENLQVGNRVKGKVVTVADYGAFIEIAPGVEGLIHVSEMSWSSHLRNPSDFLKVGDEIEAVILTLDKEDRKMSLGIKQLTPDPWGTIAEKYPVGSKHKGIVKNLTNYGLFLELEEGVDGLVHVSDLSWSKKIKHPAEFVKKGQELEVVVLEVDTENRRLSLGHKQLDENPWDTFESIFAIESHHEGTVLKIAEKGATIALPYGVEGYAPIKQLYKADKSMLKEDESAMFEVTEFNKDAKRILVSHTITWKKDEKAKANEKASQNAQDKEATKKTMKKINEKVEQSTLGDIEALANLKAELDSKK
jgi:small subunit ribosomal protein S1